jgi:hypothetical protein
MSAEGSDDLEYLRNKYNRYGSEGRLKYSEYIKAKKVPTIENFFNDLKKQEIDDALADPSNERVKDVLLGRLTKQDMLDEYEENVWKEDINQDELDDIDRIYDSYIPMYREYIMGKDMSKLTDAERSLKRDYQQQGVESSLLQQQSFDQNQGIKLKPEDRELGPNDLGIWLSPEEAEESEYKYLDEETRRLYKYDPSDLSKKIKGMKHGGLVMNYGDYGRSYK